MTLTEIILICITSGCISATVGIVMNFIRKERKLKKEKKDFDEKVKNEVDAKAKDAVKRRMWRVCADCRFKLFVDQHPKEYMEFCIEEDRIKTERLQNLMNMQHNILYAKAEIATQMNKAIEKEAKRDDPDTK